MCPVPARSMPVIVSWRGVLVWCRIGYASRGRWVKGHGCGCQYVPSIASSSSSSLSFCALLPLVRADLIANARNQAPVLPGRHRLGSHCSGSLSLTCSDMLSCRRRRRRCCSQSVGVKERGSPPQRGLSRFQGIQPGSQASATGQLLTNSTDNDDIGAA